MREIVFGPVRSRRLGLSLGVDLLVPKTCSFDCLYCEIGPTTQKTIERKCWRPTEEIQKALEVRLSDPTLHFEVLTFAGSGEPTLHQDLGKILKFAQKLTDRPICILTNSSLVFRTDVQRDLCAFDIVLPSLDAAIQETFLRLNRPVPGLKIEDIIHGLKMLREKMTGQMWLEIMLVGGINDNAQDLEALVKAVEYIKPHRVQLNTVARPPAYPEAKAIALETLQGLCDLFTPKAEVIYYKDQKENQYRRVSSEEIITLLTHRPCPSEEIAQALGYDYKDTLLVLQQLVQTGKVKTKIYQKRVFYYA